ncbi:MAG: biopolymer transport protein ExbB/TolQ/tetrahydromethanopterin S-methyltransferase subunit F [Pirellulaceae bacterium]|jgi:biopolymer transport protein ExbB/TolQ/tetrahydromethanopterin S-methyltransferase subunit F/DNA-directed RNA polymerase subunit RPC12/RpoP
MYFNLQCSSCKKTLRVREELSGRKAACPYCKATFVVTEPQTESNPEVPSELDGLKNITTGVTNQRKSIKQRVSTGSKKSGVTRESGTDVGLIKSGLIGLVAGIVMLIVLFLFRVSQIPGAADIGLLFWPLAGMFPWVQIALCLMLNWALSILFLKSRKLAQQKTSMLFDLLPTSIEERISLNSVDKFNRHVRDLPIDSRFSFLLNRVLVGLEHFRVRKSASEVSNILSSQSDIDANSVESSYTQLRFFVWAIPILGFIGTVIGISQAVGAFSNGLDGAADVSALRESLGSVTTGLATAFDTTLIALVMSIFVMFPMSSMQKAEEDLLTWVDEYCNENLLKRLDDGLEGGAARSQFTSDSEVERAIDSAMAKHHSEMAVWTRKLESIGSKLTGQVSAGWIEINDQLRTQHEQKMAELQQLETMSNNFQETLVAMKAQTESVHSDMSGSMSESAQSLQNYFASMDRGLRSLNEVLEKLGEKNVVIQQVEQAKRRRGWFW